MHSDSAGTYICLECGRAYDGKAFYLDNYGPLCYECFSLLEDKVDSVSNKSIQHLAREIGKLAREISKLEKAMKK